MLLLTLTAGWSGRIGPFSLTLNGEPFDLGGFTVELVVHDGRGLPVALQGTLVTVDPGLGVGQVFYDPDAGDFINTSRHTIAYQFHFKVTDDQGRVVFFPNGWAYSIAITPQ
jgi:hypothetical protein